MTVAPRRIASLVVALAMFAGCAPAPTSPRASQENIAARVSQNDIALCVWAQNVKASGFKLFWFLADKSITGRPDNVDHRDLLIPYAIVLLSDWGSYEPAYEDVLPVEARTAVNSLLEVCRELGAL